MKAILGQAIANLRSHKLQASLILTTLFISATLLTIGLNTLNITYGAFDRLFQRTNAPHLWLLLDASVLPTREIEARLSELPNVEETGRAYRTLETTMFLGDIREGGPNLRNWPDDDDAVGRPLLVDGRAPYPRESDAIVLDRNAATEYEVQVGDWIGILTPSGRKDLEVVGLFVSTEVCPTCFPFINYVAAGTMERLGLIRSGEVDEGALEIGLRLRDPSKIEETLQAATDILPADTVWGWDRWQDLRRYSESSILLQRILLITFTVVALLASGLLIANTIRGSARAQTRQIGLLKAVGFTPIQLSGVYLMEYLGLALAASLAGVGAGSLLAMQILHSVSMLYGETLSRPEAWILLATPVVTMLVTAAFSYLAVHRAVSINVVEAIRFGEERPRFRHGGMRAGLLRRLPVSYAVGLRDAFAQPSRAGLTAVGLGMAVVTLVSALTIKATLQSILTDLTRLGFSGDISVRRSDYISEGEVHQLLAVQPEVSAYYSEHWGSFHFPGESNYFYARFREGDLEDFHFPIVEGRLFERHGEVIAGYGLVKERGLHIDEKINIVIDDQPFSVNVVGFYRENSNDGRMLILPTSTLRQVSPESQAYTFVVKLDPAADPRNVAGALTLASNDFVGVHLIGQEDLPAYIASLPKIMNVLTVILAGIAALGTFNSVLMTVHERRRTFGLLKSIGMTPKQVILGVLTGVVGITLIAYIVGLPLGLLGIRALINAVSNSIGFGPLGLMTDEVGLVLLLPAIIALALLGASIPAYRAGRLNVVDVLRYE